MPELFRLCDKISVLRDGQYVGTLDREHMTQDAVVRMMIGRSVQDYFPEDAASRVREQVVLKVRNLSSPRSFRGMNFEVRAGEILGFAGLVGAGRSEVAKAIFGLDPEATGDVEIDGKPLPLGSVKASMRAGVGLVPEDRKRHGIVPLMGVGYNITMSVLKRYTSGGFIQSEAELAEIQNQIIRMKVKTAEPLLPIASLSGGNQQKAVVAKMLLPEPKVLILDEPTRGIDVGAKYEIYKLIFELAKQGVAVLMISSEMPEVLGISDRVLVMGEGKLRGNFVNEGLTQEKVLAAAIGQPSTEAA